MKTCYHVYHSLCEQLFSLTLELSRIPSDPVVPCHWHNEVEFRLVLSGKLECLIHGQRVRLAAGDCVFIQSDTIHKMWSIGPVARTFTICLPLSVWFTVCEAQSLQKQPKFIVIRDCIALKMLQQQLELLIQRPTCDSQQHMLLAGELCHCIKTSAETIPQPCRQRTSDSHTEKLMKDMLQYLHTHFREPIAMNMLSKHLYIGQSSLFRTFRYFSQTTPIEYLNAFRLAQAESLLQITNYPVSEVGRFCGFHAISYFDRLFKRKYGLSPMHYRKKVRSLHYESDLAEPQAVPLNHKLKVYI